MPQRNLLRSVSSVVPSPPARPARWTWTRTRPIRPFLSSRRPITAASTAAPETPHVARLASPAGRRRPAARPSVRPSSPQHSTFAQWVFAGSPLLPPAAPPRLVPRGACRPAAAHAGRTLARPRGRHARPANTYPRGARPSCPHCCQPRALRLSSPRPTPQPGPGPLQPPLENGVGVHAMPRPPGRPRARVSPAFTGVVGASHPALLGRPGRLFTSLPSRPLPACRLFTSALALPAGGA